MLNWPYRHHLGQKLRLRRSVYEVLRDQMDISLTKLALIDSYRSFCRDGIPYPFVPKRELKPRAIIVDEEYNNHNHFLIIFCEGSIPSEHKKYIRFFDHNKVTKEAIEKTPTITLHKDYTRNLRFFNNPNFGSLIKDLSNIDYALLVQNDPSIKKENRYMMTHFHVRVDWPIDNATEDMAHQYRYISKELYEKGEKYAHHLENKLFENYGFHHSVGGRRTAAVVVSQLLKKMPFISTVYVSSAESRALTRISERGVSRYVLIKISNNELKKIAKEQSIPYHKMIEQYLVDKTEDYGVGILHVVYRNSDYSKPPLDGKIRRLWPDYQWLTVNDQILMPLPDFPDAHPLRYHTIYSAD
jgi:hypothetical protein